MKTFDIWVGDREWEKAHGERLAGQIQGNTIEEAYELLKNPKNWAWQCGHIATAGYWLCMSRRTIEEERIIQTVQRRYSHDCILSAGGSDLVQTPATFYKGSSPPVPEGEMKNILHFYFPGSEQSRSFCYHNEEIFEVATHHPSGVYKLVRKVPSLQ